MNDASSQEIPTKEIPGVHKPSEIPTKRINLLGMSEINYNELPGSFEAGEELIDAAALLRDKTEAEKEEVGGVLTKDQEDKLGFKIAGKQDYAGRFALQMIQITDKNLRWFIERQIKTTQDGKPAKA